MAHYGYQIVKKVFFRGVQQEFANVYYYKHPTAVQNNHSAFIDDIVAIERNLHATQVTFVRAMAWSAGGTNQQNQMLLQKPLSGTGNQTNNTSMDKERAVLFQWPAGLDIRGRPVYLRKWFHSCGGCAGVPFSSGHLDNSAEINSTDRATIATEINKLRLLGAVDQWMLVARNGREHTGPGSTFRYLEHHQLGDMWR